MLLAVTGETDLDEAKAREVGERLEAMFAAMGMRNVRVEITSTDTARPVRTHQIPNPKRPRPKGLREIRAKFESPCSVCGQTIAKGDVQLYDYTRKRAYCLQDRCREAAGPVTPRT